MKERGFTLLEVLVATLVMGLAVVGLLSAISTSMRNAARVTDYDRVVLLARAQMDTLLLNRRLPYRSIIQGSFDPTLMGGREAGWRARVTPFEKGVIPEVGLAVLERVELEVWWNNGSDRRTFTLDTFRRKIARADDIAVTGVP